MAEFRMPALGADMDAGTLVEWKVKAGDSVHKGEVVAVVETQKGAIDVEIWQDGVIEQLVAAPGTRAPVGAVLALVSARGAEGAQPAASPDHAPAAGAAGAQAALPAAPSAPAAVPGEAAQAATAQDAERIHISPSARRRAEALGLDIGALEPATPGAPISLADVERAHAARASQAAAPAPQADWRVPMREAIAAAMSRAKREIPHYYLATEIDITALDAWLAAENEKRPVAARLLPVVPLMKAVALALRAVPELNGVWHDGAFRPSAAVHLGMAIAMRGGGLVAPAIHDADGKSLDALMERLRDLVTRVRGGRLRSSEMSDPTVTLTNLGDVGVQQVFGVIYPPQVAIVGLGSAYERMAVREARLVVRKTINATLSADHRVSDGHRGALFLAQLGRLLQDPEQLR